MGTLLKAIFFYLKICARTCQQCLSRSAGQRFSLEAKTWWVTETSEITCYFSFCLVGERAQINEAVYWHVTACCMSVTFCMCKCGLCTCQLCMGGRWFEVSSRLCKFLSCISSTYQTANQHYLAELQDWFGQIFRRLNIYLYLKIIHGQFHGCRLKRQAGQGGIKILLMRQALSGSLWGNCSELYVGMLDDGNLMWWAWWLYLHVWQ